MTFDLKILGNKLKKYREQFKLTISELSNATGIEKTKISQYENGERKPTGDEILIFADYYKCDYRFFISNEIVAPFEQTETLFRNFSGDFSKSDRWAVQEFLFLSECEDFLQKNLKRNIQDFIFIKKGNHFKTHGIDAAISLRKKMGYSDNAVPLDIFKDFRSIGIHVFRRRLENLDISGLYVKHPVAGKCILINYNEDIYRQRFTAAHEAGHAILDKEEDFVISFSKWEKSDLKEVRVNAFASHYLMPQHFLKAIPEPKMWNEKKAIEWASNLKVSTIALAYALKEANLINKETMNLIKKIKVPKDLKIDPEIPETYSNLEKQRKKNLLEKGLSNYYVNLCFDGYREGIISAARIREMLLVTEYELIEIAELFREKFKYDS